MQPQHLAAQCSCECSIEALPSQTRRLHRAGYVFAADCSMVTSRTTQVFLTSVTVRVRQFNDARTTHTDRRLRCQRASNSWQPLVSSPLLLPVRPARPKKNMLLSSPSPSRLSQHTQVSTSKRTPDRPFAPDQHEKSGQAVAPVPPHIQMQPFNRRAV